jgi:adenine/guanine/hypoxanthine permease
MRWFVRGDFDGFVALALDNLVQLLLIDALCRGVLGFSQELVYGRILPGVALSLIVGNLFYAYQARKLAEATGRTDVCALPYGINTVSLFAHIFLVMLPAKLAAAAAGLPDPSDIAWKAGLVACLGSGLIEFSGAFVAEKLRTSTPRAALLSTLSGIALGFISLGFFFRTFAHPVVGLSTLAIILLAFFGSVKFKGGLPGGMIAVMVGTAMAWITGLAPGGPSPSGAGFYPPIPTLGPLAAGLSGGALVSYFSVILPMGLFNVVGSLQNIESAEAAGDTYETRSALAVNGVGTVLAACFGSCFPTTIYIGHPGWKILGARAGYSILNGVFIAAICLTGTLSAIAWAIPIDAGMAIVLWIGIVITAQAFQVTPRAHAPAVVMGVLPGLAAWAVLIAKNSLHAAGLGTPGGKPFSADLIPAFEASDTWITGGFALEQGFIFTSLILAAATVAIIEQEFRKAGIWFLVGAAISTTGLMHSYKITPSDVVMNLSPAWSWAYGYLIMAAILFVAPYLTVPREPSVEPVEEATSVVSS